MQKSRQNMGKTNLMYSNGVFFVAWCALLSKERAKEEEPWCYCRFGHVSAWSDLWVATSAPLFFLTGHRCISDGISHGISHLKMSMSQHPAWGTKPIPCFMVSKSSCPSLARRGKDDHGWPTPGFMKHPQKVWSSSPWRGTVASDEAPRNPRFVKGHLSRHLSVSGLHGKGQQVEVDPAAMDHSFVTSS